MNGTGAVLVSLCALSAFGADIQGTIVVKHKLTRRTVTPAAGAYDRGVQVKLASDRVEDPLAFERMHVVVWLEDGTGGAPVLETIEQKDRRFSPDLTVIPAGSSVSFPNFDPIFHNVFSLSKAKSFDLGNYSRGQSRTVMFEKPGIVLVNCHLHSNMASVIVVTPNQWFTRADADGRFVIRNVPPGKHNVVAWHKASGFFRVVAEPGREIQFLIPLDDNGRPMVEAGGQ